MNTEVVKLVQGDTAPQVAIQLIDRKTGRPINLCPTNLTPKLLFRSAGSATTSFRSTLSKISTARSLDGFALLTFTDGQLDIETGMYEGQPYVEDSTAGTTDTCKNKVRFRVIEKFASPS